MSCTASPAHSTAAALFWQELCLPLRKSRTDLASLSREPEKEGPGPPSSQGTQASCIVPLSLLLCVAAAGPGIVLSPPQSPRTLFSSLLSGKIISIVRSPWALQGACCFSSWRGAGDGCGESQGIPSGAWGNLSGLDRGVVTDRSVVTAVLAALSEPFVPPALHGPCPFCQPCRSSVPWALPDVAQTKPPPCRQCEISVPAAGFCPVSYMFPSS